MVYNKVILEAITFGFRVKIGRRDVERCWSNCRLMKLLALVRSIGGWELVVVTESLRASVKILAQLPLTREPKRIGLEKSGNIQVTLRCRRRMRSEKALRLYSLQRF